MLPLREIINVCVRAKKTKKNKRDFSLAVRHSQKIIIIDLIIVKLFRVCPVIFPFKEKRFFYVNICDYYFELLIFVIILFGTQQVKYTFLYIHFYTNSGVNA